MHPQSRQASKVGPLKVTQDANKPPTERERIIQRAVASGSTHMGLGETLSCHGRQETHRGLPLTSYELGSFNFKLRNFLMVPTVTRVEQRINFFIKPWGGSIGTALHKLPQHTHALTLICIHAKRLHILTFLERCINTFVRSPRIPGNRCVTHFMSHY